MKRILIIVLSVGFGCFFANAQTEATNYPPPGPKGIKARTLDEYRYYQKLQIKDAMKGKYWGIEVTPELDKELSKERASVSPAEDKTAKLYDLNFKDVPLPVFLDFYSSIIGKTISAAPGMMTTITLKSDKRLNYDEAVSICQKALDERGLTLIETNTNSLAVVRKK